MKKIFQTQENFDGDYLKYYSISALNDYKECSWYYKLKRIDKLETVPFTNSTLIGNICHNALENYYEGAFSKSLLQCMEDTLGTTLIETRVFTKVDNTKNILSKLMAFAKDNLQLHVRASADYKGRDPIRKNDGKVAQKPQSTSAWTKAFEQLNFPVRMEDIINEALLLNYETLVINLPTIVSDAYNICNNYKIPEDEREIVELELPISELDKENYRILNPVTIPGYDDTYIKCFIDKLAYYSYNGKDRLAVIDYKSSAVDKSEEHVGHDAQLLLYAYVVEKITGLKVELIGIHNLRSGKLSLAELDLEVQKDILANLFERCGLINKEVYYKQHFPDSIYSKCLNSFGGTCPFIGSCYPKYQLN